jgi:hypothetical protein
LGPRKPEEGVAYAIFQAEHTAKLAFERANAAGKRKKVEARASVISPGLGTTQDKGGWFKRLLGGAFHVGVWRGVGELHVVGTAAANACVLFVWTHDLEGGEVVLPTLKEGDRGALQLGQGGIEQSGLVCGLPRGILGAVFITSEVTAGGIHEEVKFIHDPEAGEPPEQLAGA